MLGNYFLASVCLINFCIEFCQINFFVAFFNIFIFSLSKFFFWTTIDWPILYNFISIYIFPLSTTPYITFNISLLHISFKLHSSFFYDFEILFPSNWPFANGNISIFLNVMTISWWAKKASKTRKFSFSFSRVK